MNDNKKTEKDNSHYKTLFGAFLSLVSIVAFVIGILYLFEFIDNNNIDILKILISVLGIIKLLFPLLALIILLGIFYRLGKNKK